MILITGASGFLGRRLVVAAVQRGLRVRALVRDPSDHDVHRALNPVHLVPVLRASQVMKRSSREERRILARSVSEEPGCVIGTDRMPTQGISEEPGCLIHQGDITDPATLGAALDGIDAVIHAAATTSEAAPDEALSWRTNVEGTRNLLEACRDAGVKRWIQISSLSANRANTSVYGRSKFAADEEVRRSGLRWTILQPGTIYGPGSRGLFAKMVRLTNALPAVPVIGSGTQLMRPVHVDDVAAATMACLDQEAAVGHTYALGGRDAITFNDFLRGILEAQGKKKALIHIPLWACFPLARVLSFFLKNPPVTVDNLVGLRQMTAPDIAAAERDFGFAPRTLAEGLHHTFCQAPRQGDNETRRQGEKTK
jgi:nucleoside-diphosphate-sugar epimerase